MLQRTESHGPLGLGDRIRSMSLSPALQGAGVTVQLRTPSVVVASTTSSDNATEPSSAMKSRMWFVTVGGQVALTVFVSYLIVPTVVVAVVAPPSATGSKNASDSVPAGAVRVTYHLSWVLGVKSHAK